MSNRNPSQIHDFPLEQVPNANRHGWLRLTIVWAGFVLCMTNFLTGSTVSYGLNLNQSLLALLIGNGILTGIAITQGMLAHKTGYSFSYLTRFTFGTLGAKVVSLFIALSFIGWSAVGIGLAAETVGPVVHLNPRLIALAFTAIFSLSALFGLYGMSRVSALGIPIILFISIFGLFQILRSKGFELVYLFEIPPYRTSSFGKAVSVTVGSWIVGAIAAPDILRYARRRRDVIISMLIAFLFINTLQQAIGSAMGLVTGTWNLPIILSKLGFGTFGIILLVFISWTTADNNMYAAGLGLSTFLDDRKRMMPTVICIIAGGILSVIGFYSYFSAYLYILSVIFTPVGSIMIVDYLLSSKQRSYTEEGMLKVSWRAYASLAIGVTVGFLVNPEYGFAVSMLTGGAIYLLLVMVQRIRMRPS